MAHDENDQQDEGRKRYCDEWDNARDYESARLLRAPH
jgi:hypothetical protein